MQSIYLGVVGQIASGKGELVECLVKQHGFAAFNLSSILHKVLKDKGIKDFTRADLQDLGDRLRKEEGEGGLAKRAVKELRVTGCALRVVIEGIRNPAEVNYLRTLPNFKLIAVTAKRSVRFKRLLRRAKPWDPKTWREFLVVDRRDKGIGQKKYGQQVGRCLKMSDYQIVNNGSLVALRKKINYLAGNIIVSSQR